MNAYDRAASIWVEKQFGYPEGSVGDVTFADFGEGCDTCGFGGGFGLEFSLHGHREQQELPDEFTAGRFLEECVEILQTVVVA